MQLLHRSIFSFNFNLLLLLVSHPIVMHLLDFSRLYIVYSLVLGHPSFPYPYLPSSTNLKFFIRMLDSWNWGLHDLLDVYMDSLPYNNLFRIYSQSIWNIKKMLNITSGWIFKHLSPKVHLGKNSQTSFG